MIVFSFFCVLETVSRVEQLQFMDRFVLVILAVVNMMQNKVYCYLLMGQSKSPYLFYLPIFQYIIIF